jgi:hypothetical protein
MEEKPNTTTHVQPSTEYNRDRSPMYEPVLRGKETE